jgi:hypothetical protein
MSYSRYSFAEAVFLFAILLTIYFLPEKFIFGNESLCLLKNTLGIECPGCGMTRAVYCLLHGRIEESLSYNIGIVPLVLAGIYYLVSRFRKGNKIVGRLVYAALPVTLLLQYGIRLISAS